MKPHVALPCFSLAYSNIKTKNLPILFIKLLNLIFILNIHLILNFYKAYDFLT